MKIIGIGASNLDDFDSMRQSMFFVQEYMDGGSLKDKVIAQMMERTKEVYSMQDALQWLIEIASAVHYLHAVCRPMIIHRDLKLENILLTGDPPVVSDVHAHLLSLYAIIAACSESGPYFHNV